MVTWRKANIDIDGETETLVAHEPAEAKMTVFRPNALGASRPRCVADATEVLDIAVTAEYIAVADVIDDVSGLPEVLILDANAGVGANDLYVYRWSTALSTLVSIDGPFDVGDSPTGIATGDLDANGFAELSYQQRRYGLHDHPHRQQRHPRRHDDHHGRQGRPAGPSISTCGTRTGDRESPQR